MSAPILYPGDAIHLALPISSALYGDEAQREGKRLNDEQVAFYAQFGVTVAQTSCNSKVDAPTVVAVFRHKEVDAP